MPKAFHSARYGELRRILIAKRKAADMTQAEVAGRLHRPQSYVAKYERGERRIDVIEFIEIADAIGFDPAKLVWELVKSRLRSKGRTADVRFSNAHLERGTSLNQGRVENWVDPPG